MRIKVALIHDWLLMRRGGEKVFEAIAELFPEADIFTLFHEPGASGEVFERHHVTASRLNRLPGVRRYYRYLLPLLPITIEAFDLSSYDLVISSSHCVAKGVIPSPRAMHLCYSHTPMRYAWDRRDDYFRSAFQRLLSRPILHRLRTWDVASSARVDAFIANSEWVAARIRRYYGRPSTVINPFVDGKFFSVPVQSKQDFYLVVSDFAPYKRIELAIEACAKLGRKLVVVGDGQDRKRLRRHSGPHVEFRGKVSHEELVLLYSQARALLFPGEEDFGIAPVEAMACGCPVLAFGRGGLTETVVAGETGLFFDEQTADSLARTMLLFEAGNHGISDDSCRARARSFTKEKFQTEFRKVIEALTYRRESRGIDRPDAPTPISH